MLNYISMYAGMSELADETDSKSVIREGVWVQVPLPALLHQHFLIRKPAGDLLVCGLFVLLLADPAHSRSDVIISSTSILLLDDPAGSAIIEGITPGSGRSVP